ncbi:MAG: tRNA (cytidine(34)-2'-O)-methyltransferase [Clostridiales bacterium]|nr:tRNA (cytidine(34)-2'-O)-methyltransferase [Clostridiales bacterium]
MPEIPGNTGNISRTCAVTGTALHLIKPLGFSLEDKFLKRAGLDYWELLDVRVHESLEDFLKLHGGEKLWLVETAGQKRYDEAHYPEDSFFVFGRETLGLPKGLVESYPEHTVRVPMLPERKARSLNLSNTAALVLYEALRQNGFPGLS